MKSVSALPESHQRGLSVEGATVLLARLRRLYIAVFASALLVGGAVGLIGFFVAITSGPPAGAQGVRNPGAFGIMVIPLALGWGLGHLVHWWLRRVLEPRWSEELSARYPRER
jgi:hypothetical protein